MCAWISGAWKDNLTQIVQNLVLRRSGVDMKKWMSEYGICRYMLTPTAYVSTSDKCHTIWVRLSLKLATTSLYLRMLVMECSRQVSQAVEFPGSWRHVILWRFLDFRPLLRLFLFFFFWILFLPIFLFFLFLFISFFLFLLVFCFVPLFLFVSKLDSSCIFLEFFIGSPTSFFLAWIAVK